METRKPPPLVNTEAVSIGGEAARPVNTAPPVFVRKSFGSFMPPLLLFAGLTDRAKEKPAAAVDKPKKVAPFHRILVDGGQLKTVQAWTRGEARAELKRRGYTIDKSGQQATRERRAA